MRIKVLLIKCDPCKMVNSNFFDYVVDRSWTRRLTPERSVVGGIKYVDYHWQKPITAIAFNNNILIAKRGYVNWGKVNAVDVHPLVWDIVFAFPLLLIKWVTPKSTVTFHL